MEKQLKKFKIKRKINRLRSLSPFEGNGEKARFLRGMRLLGKMVVVFLG